VPDALASGAAVHVNRVLDDSGVYLPGRNRRGGHPADDAAGVDSHVAMAGKPGGGEGLPVWRAGLEGGVAFLDSGLVDREHGSGVRVGHRLDAHASG